MLAEKSVPYYFEPAPSVQYKGISHRLSEQCSIGFMPCSSTAQYHYRVEADSSIGFMPCSSTAQYHYREEAQIQQQALCLVAPQLSITTGWRLTLAQASCLVAPQLSTTTGWRLTLAQASCLVAPQLSITTGWRLTLHCSKRQRKYSHSWIFPVSIVPKNQFM